MSLRNNNDQRPCCGSSFIVQSIVVWNSTIIKNGNLYSPCLKKNQRNFSPPKSLLSSLPLLGWISSRMIWRWCLSHGVRTMWVMLVPWCCLWNGCHCRTWWDIQNLHPWPWRCDIGSGCCLVCNWPLYNNSTRTWRPTKQGTTSTVNYRCNTTYCTVNSSVKWVVGIHTRLRSTVWIRIACYSGVHKGRRLWRRHTCPPLHNNADSLPIFHEGKYVVKNKKVQWIGDLYNDQLKRLNLVFVEGKSPQNRRYAGTRRWQHFPNTSLQSSKAIIVKTELSHQFSDLLCVEISLSISNCFHFIVFERKALNLSFHHSKRCRIHLTIS